MEDNKMLDEKDLQSIAGLITKTESKILTEMDKRFTQSENLILDELDRTRSIMEKKIEVVQRNIDELSQYYRITKLESDNTTLLLQMINDLRKEVEELKQKIA